jgi:hypothetical protein
MTTQIGKLKNPNEENDMNIEFESIHTDKKMSISEVIDMIPIGTEILLNLCCQRNWYSLKTRYIHVESDRILKENDKDYEIFCGICVSNLSEDHIDFFPKLKSYFCDVKNKYRKGVIITKIFPETTCFKTQVLKSGEIIKSIFGYTNDFEIIEETNRSITSLNDVRHILNLRPSLLQITTLNNSTFVCTSSNFVPEDKKLIEINNIKHKYLYE